jgi:hypothetical protein
LRGPGEELNGGKRSDHSGGDHQSEPAQKRKERRSRCNLPYVRNECWDHQDAGGLCGRHYDAEKAHANGGQSESKYALNASSEQEHRGDEHGEAKF